MRPVRTGEEAREVPGSVAPGDGHSPWPAALELGVRRLGPFEPCALCETGTWVRYGEAPRCLECARDPGGAPRRRYRRALERWWTLVGQGERASLASQAAIAATYQEILKLTDDLGPATADTLCRQWALEWEGQTKCDPWSGHTPWSGQPDATGETRL